MDTPDPGGGQLPGRLVKASAPVTQLASLCMTVRLSGRLEDKLFLDVVRPLQQHSSKILFIGKDSFKPFILLAILIMMHFILSAL